MIIGDMEIRLRADIARLQRDMDQARSVVNSTASGIGQAADQMKAALAGIGLGTGLAQLIQMSDQYTKFTAQLKLATGSQQEYAQALAEVKRISTDAQSGMAGTGTLYARIANGTRELGVSQKQVADITETVSLALKVSGATAEEAASAQLQLSQAFASGTLRGEEFNAVNEAAPRLMKVLADGMGVPIGALKEMASNGQITSRIMADVFGAPEKLRDESKQIQTISGAFQVLKDRVMEYTAVHAEANGSVAVLTSGIGLLAKYFGELMGVLTTLTAAKLGTTLSAWTVKTYEQITAAAALRAANIALLQSELANSGAKVTQLTATEAAIVAERQLVIARLAEARANIVSAEAAISAASAAGAQSFALRTLRLATAELAVAETQRAAMMAELAILGRQQTSVSAQLAAAKTAEAAAQLGLNAATSAGAAAAGVASRALGFLGGPVGALITVLGLAAVAWSHWGSSAEKGNKQAAETFEEAQARIVKGLDEQIEKNEKLIELQNGGMSKPVAEKSLPVIKQIEAAQEKLKQMDSSMTLAPGQSWTQFFAKRVEVENGIVELQQKLAKATSTGETAANGTREQKIAEWLGKNGSSAQRMAAELAELRKQFGSLTPEMERLVRVKYEDKGAASALKQEQTAYQNLMTSIQEKIAANRLEMSGYNQLSDSQKLTIALDAEIATGKTNLNARDIERARAQIAVVAAMEAVSASNKRAAAGAEEYTKMVKGHDDQVAKSIQSANDEATKNEELVATFGMTKAAIEQLELARLQDQLSQRATTGLTLEEIAALEKLIDAKKRNVASASRLEDLTGAQKGLDDLNQFLDPSRAQDFGDALKGAFNGAGDAISKMTKVLDDFGRKSAQIDKQRGNAANAYLNGITDEKEYLAELSQISKKDTQERLAGYGDMAGAAAGFFGEQSNGYKALTTVSQVFHAAELAMTLAELVPKGISAVLSQGQGDPYSAFARMAAMTALVAGLGVAIGGGGGGGGKSPAEIQKAQGTGSVFGDSTAKSDSIKRAMELVASNSSIELDYTRGMLTSLRSIESSLGGLGNLLVRTSGITSAAAGIQVSDSGGFFGKLVSSIFGGKTSVQDTGFMIDRTTLAAAAAGGVNSYSYADMKKSGGWFSSGKSWTDSTELGEAADAQFSKVLADLGAGVTEAAKLLGLGGDAFTERLNSFVIDIGKISLNGLSGEQIQEQLEAVFSKVGDDLAKFGVGGLEQFQQVGEGYFETLTRIATDYANLNSVMESIGATFGSTGMASIAARERLIELAGGIDELASQTSAFSENFLSKAEQLAPVQKYVTDQLAAMGLQSLDTRDKFKDYVLGLANSGQLATEAGAQQYTALLALADAFAKTHAATVDLTKSEQEITDERTGLQNKLDELTMTQAQLAEKARAAIDGHNLSLYDSVQAAQVAETRRKMEISLMEAQGNAAGVLAANRSTELAAMNESLRELQERINAQLDANAAAQEAVNVLALQAQMYELNGDKAGAAAVLAQQHTAALVGLTPAMAAATQALWNVQAAAKASKDALAAVSDAYKAVSTVIDREKKYLNDAYTVASDAMQAGIDSGTEAVTKLTSLSESLKSTLDAMKIPGQEREERAAAQAQIEAALAIAKAGGPLPDADSLKSALSTVSKDASSQFSTQLDYLRDLYRTKNAVSALGSLTDTKLSAEQQMLDTLKEQKKALDTAHKAEIALLDNQLDQLKTQTDLLNGIATSLMTLPDALKVLAAAMGAATKDPTVGTDALTSLYKTLLGRTPDAGGLAYWQQVLAGGASLSDVAAGIKNDYEYKGLHSTPAFAGGGDHLGGLRLVGEDGPELEATGPSRIFNASQTRSMLSGGDSAVVVELRELRKQIARLEASSERTATGGEKVAKIVQRVGGQGDYFVVKVATEETA